MGKFQPLSFDLGKSVWLLVFLLGAAGCGSTDAPAETTPLPQGMEFDEASQIYELVPGASEARFLIDEILRIETTNPVVFDVTAVPVSGTRIEGSARTTIQRADFNLFVPSATGVAGVEEDVILEIDFTAEAPQ